MESNQVKSRRKINRIHDEYLLNNIIDEEFQAMLFPLGLVPSFFLMSHFQIINNFITPDNDVPCYIKSLIGSIIVVLGHFLRFDYYSEAVKSFSSSVVIVLFHFDLIFYSLVSIITYFVSSLQRAHVVDLLIKLQYILNCIKIDKSDFLSKHKLHNWLSVLIIFSIYIFNRFCVIQEFGFLKCFVSFMLTLPIIIFDMHIVTVTRVIVLIKNELLAWNHKIQKYTEICTSTKDHTVNFTLSEVDMFDAYVNIIKSFRLCNKIYKFSLTYYGFQTFIQILMTLELVLELGRSSPADNFVQTTLMKFLSTAWNMKSFMLLTVLSIAAENFYRSVKIAETSCAQILSNGHSAGTGIHATCKNVLRLNRAALRKLSAFGVFELDAAFPLRLLGGLVTYTVVLLQFAFMSS